MIFASIQAYNHYNYETEEENEETPDYGEGFPAGEPTGGQDGGDPGAWEAGFNEVGAPQVKEGL